MQHPDRCFFMVTKLFVKNYRTPASVKARVLSVGFLSVLAVSVITPFAFAWNVSVSATSLCEPEDHEQAVIEVSFTNNESSREIDVIAKDLQSGRSISLGEVEAKHTAHGEIVPHRTELNKGAVAFFMTWAKGESGSDTRYASYNSIDCELPKPTSTPTPTEKPTQTPTPTPTQMPTMTATPTPTVTPTQVPTEMPTPTPTNTPSTNNNNSNTQNNGGNNQSQNSNNNNSNSNDNHTDVNVTNNNNVNVTNTVPAPQTATVESVTVESPTVAKELPSTGTPFEVYEFFSALLPIGWKLRKFAKLG